MPPLPRGIMQKLSIELPKHRLLLHFRVIKRRKSLVDEALIPTIKDVKKKYRKGTLLSRYFRHVFEHKSIKKVFGTGFALAIIGTSFVPQNTVLAQGSTEDTVVQIQNTLTTEKGIQLPLANYKLNQGFNFFHPGVDLGAEVGDPIKPIKAGVIIEAGWSIFGYGNTILIDHGQGLTSRYAHLSKIEVKVGDKITTNIEIGQVGVSGHTTGSHLHLEVHQNGIPINPLSVIPL